MVWKIRYCYNVNLSQSIFRLNTILIKIQGTNFVDIDKLFPKFTWKDKRRRITDTIVKKNKSWRTCNT